MTEQFEVTVKRKTYKWWESLWVFRRNKPITGLKLEDWDVIGEVTTYYEKKKGLYYFDVKTEIKVKPESEIAILNTASPKIKYSPIIPSTYCECTDISVCHSCQDKVTTEEKRRIKPPPPEPPLPRTIKGCKRPNSKK